MKKYISPVAIENDILAEAIYAASGEDIPNVYDDPEPTPEATPEPTPETTPEPTEAPTPEVTPETTPEVTPDPTPDVTPEPETTPEVTPEPTMVTGNTEPVEGGAGECWTIGVNRDQEDAGGYSTYRLQCNHLTNQQHLSVKTRCVLTFSGDVTNAKFEGFNAEWSGSTVVLTRESLGDSYLSGDNYNSLLQIWPKGLECTSSTIYCTHTVNVQGNG